MEGLHYTQEQAEAIKAEAEYLAKRRALNQLPEEAGDWKGICLSGEGMRASTMGLGFFQGMIRAGKLKEIDYLCTVSGGGYIGACLSSLLSGDKRKLTGGVQPGVDPENSPLVGLEQEKEYVSAKQTRLNVRHQLHHLRSHGEFLARARGIVSRDIQRAVGVLLSGLFHNLFLFLLLLVSVAAFHFFFFYLISDGHFFEDVNFRADSMQPDANPLTHVANSISNFVNNSLGYHLDLISGSVKDEWEWALIYLITGVVVGVIFIIRVPYLLKQILKERKSIRNYNKDPQTLSGYNLEGHYEYHFLRRFNLVAIFGGPLLSLIFGVAVAPLGLNYWIVFALPFSFALGIAAASYALLPIILNRSYRRERVLRSLFGGLQGGAFYGLIASFLMPLALTSIFSASVSWNLIYALGSLVLAYLIFRIQRPVLAEQVGWIRRLWESAQKPLLGLLVLLAVGFAFSAISGILIGLDSNFELTFRLGKTEQNYYNLLVIEQGGIKLHYLSLVVLFWALLLFIFLGYFVNANSISPHLFFSDRLSEAFLKTDARVKRQGWNKQGMPLINIRNDEDLLLSRLGDGNNRGPYHIMVAALNLQGSRELNQKNRKSASFLFTRDYVGSRITGYVDTAFYRGGKTKLCRAMTISAALFNPNQGYRSYFATSFFSTLFNIRFGQWIENPWFYRSGGPTNPEQRRTYWPRYLLQEMLGRTNARGRLVNLSDGRYSGDPLGLLPLLERRCKLILVCDFNYDPEYEFRDFNSSARHAYTENNIRIEIDLGSFEPEQEKQAVFKGTAHYPDGDSVDLIYVKACMIGGLPMQVQNYHRSSKGFPHQKRTDLFFQDDQFEAYRALGEFLGKKAAGMMNPDSQTAPVS